MREPALSADEIAQVYAGPEAHLSASRAHPKPAGFLKPGSRSFLGLALMCTILWAGAQIAVKEGLSYCPPMTLMSMRFLAAGFLLQPICWLLKSPSPKTAGAWGRIATLGFLNNTLYLGITALGLVTVSAGLNCVLTGVNPLLLAAGGWLMFGEVVTLSSILGLLGALGGVTYVMANRLGHDNQPQGIALIMLANCIMVLGNLLYKRWSHESGLVRNHSLQLILGGFSLGALALWTEDQSLIQWEPQLFLSLGFLVFGVSFGAMLSWLYMLAQGDTGQAGAFLFLVPLFGLGLGALLLGEPAQLSDLIGALVATICVGWVQRPKPRAQKALADLGA